MHLFVAVAGCGLADRQCNEDIADELAVVDISTTVKIVVNCCNIWKECLKNRILNPLHYCNCKFRLYLSLKTVQLRTMCHVPRTLMLHDLSVLTSVLMRI